MDILEKNREEYKRAIAEGKRMSEGLLLEGILKRYEELYNNSLLSPREYIRQLKNEGKIISKSDKDIKGKALVFK